ncbi:transposon ty3-G gag-pol polyprotein [Tanacetum coccineum]
MTWNRGREEYSTTSIDQAWGIAWSILCSSDVHFEVVVGNREKMVCTGRVKDLTIVIQGYTITTDFFVLPVAACPIVLGVQCDASGVGIGAVLTQSGKPLAYFSAPLKGTMLSWSTYEKEMLAVVKAVRKWWPYLLGRAFVVKTDHMSLKYLLEQRISTPAQTKWLTKLLGYDYKIEYKKRATNRGADALSRCPEFQFMAFSHPCTTLWCYIKGEVATVTRLPPKLVPYIRGTTKVQEVDEYLCDRDEVLRQLRNNLLASQNRMKVNADRHHRELEFNVGDLVYIKLQPYRQSSVVSRYSAKLAPRFFGPYKILNRVGPVAYRVELPPGSLIHDVFHLSPTLMQPEEILEERVVQKGKYRPKTELLVKWRGRPREDATWETKWRFVRAYPDFHLEDKATVSGVDCYVPTRP